MVSHQQSMGVQFDGIMFGIVHVLQMRRTSSRELHVTACMWTRILKVEEWMLNQYKDGDHMIFQ